MKLSYNNSPGIQVVLTQRQDAQGFYLALTDTEHGVTITEANVQFLPAEDGKPTIQLFVHSGRKQGSEAGQFRACKISGETFESVLAIVKQVMTQYYRLKDPSDLITYIV